MAKIWQCVIRQACFGQQIQNTMWLLQDSDTVLPDQTLADAIGTEISTAWQPYVANDLQFVDLYFNDTTLTGPGVTYVPSNFPLLGAQTGQLLPLQNSVLLTLRALPPGYPVQNRKYIAGATEDQIINGVLLAAEIAEFANIGDVFDNVYTDGSGNIWTAGLSSASPRNFKPAVSVSVSAEIFTQRRRRRRI